MSTQHGCKYTVSGKSGRLNNKLWASLYTVHNIETIINN